MTRWRDRSLPQHAYAIAPGTTRYQATQQQDSAAGSRVNRMLDTGGSPRVLARVRFVRRPKTRRVYAYLVWSEHRRRHELLLCEALLITRQANLDAAWKVVHTNDLLTVDGRARWPSTRR